MHMAACILLDRSPKHSMMSRLAVKCFGVAARKAARRVLKMQRLKSQSGHAP